MGDFSHVTYLDDADHVKHIVFNHNHICLVRVTEDGFSIVTTHAGIQHFPDRKLLAVNGPLSDLLKRGDEAIAEWVIEEAAE